MFSGGKGKKTGRGRSISSLSAFCIAIVAFVGAVGFSGAYAFDAKLGSAQEIGIYDPVEIDFSQPVVSLERSNITLSPNINFSYGLSEDRGKLFIVPSGTLAFEKKYVVTLSGVRGISGLVLDGKSFTFFTREDKISSEKVSAVEYAKDMEEDFGEIKLSKNKYISPATSQVKVISQITPHILEGKYIDVSIPKQTMTLFEDGVQVNQFKVSTGKVGMATPLGEFKVLSKETNHWSYKYKLWMPYSMNFASGGYYIHELPYWPNGYREGESHLGRRVSHGCVRLGIGPAKYVFDWSEIGTPVYIH